MNQIAFPSGLTIKRPLNRLSRFLTDEFEWYDCFTDPSPNSIAPFDVLVAAGINAYIGGASASRLRTIHVDLVRECSDPLKALPAALDLALMTDVAIVADLLLAGVRANGAQSAVVTKILHRKRRQAIPILDSVVVGHYCDKKVAATLAETYVTEVNRRAALVTALKAVQTDLQGSAAELAQLKADVTTAGWSIGTLRIHDILAWTEVEPRGYYR